MHVMLFLQVWAACFYFVMVLLCLVYYTIQGQALVYFTSSLALAQVRGHSIRMHDFRYFIDVLPTRYRDELVGVMSWGVCGCKSCAELAVSNSSRSTCLSLTRIRSALALYRSLLLTPQP